MDEITSIKFEIGGDILELVTLYPMEEDVYMEIVDLVEVAFKGCDLAKMTEDQIRDKLAEIFYDVAEEFDVELFCPKYEEESIARIERILEDYE